MVKHENIDNYINAQADFTIEKLVEIRAIIKAVIPNAIEVISYGMPAFKYNNEVLVYFAACKKHLGFTLPIVQLPILKTSCLNIKTQKAAFNFLTIPLCQKCLLKR